MHTITIEKKAAETGVENGNRYYAHHHDRKKAG